MNRHPLIERCMRMAAAWCLAAAFAFMVFDISMPVPAFGQPLPVTSLAYSAKYLCGFNAPGPGGVVTDLSLPYGCSDYTVVEVHNPHTTPVTITVKVVQDYPFSATLVAPFQVNLAANQAWNWDCTNLAGAPLGAISRGFVEVSSPRQLKVVALYKELCSWSGLVKSASVAKKSSPAFFFLGLVRHSGTFLVGDDVTAKGDTIRHETTISLANMCPNPVNAIISITNQAGPVHSYPVLLQPNGFTTVTGANLPAFVPRPFVGGVTVQYVDSFVGVPLLECEEIIQKYVIGGLGGAVMGQSVVEVQPIPVR